METNLVLADPELLARLDVLATHLESTNYLVSVILLSILFTLGCTVAVLVVYLLYRALKQFI